MATNVLGTLKNLVSANTSYRTGVPNDFSIVEKAIFYTFEYDSEKSLGSNLPYNYVEALPVQINPDNIREDHYADYSNMQSLKTSNIDIATCARTREHQPKGNHRLDLDYDVYDEYNLRTGGMGITNAITSSNSNPTLKDKNFTTLPKLIEAAKDPLIYVGFKWGDFEYFGFISELSTSYNTFSRYGEPLKGKAEIVVSHVAINYPSNDKKTAEPLPVSTLLKSKTISTVGTAKKILSGIAGALR